MGLNESNLRALTKPCQTCTHECNNYSLDNMEFDSNCSKCCEVHLKTHAHTDSDSEYESAQEPEQNATHPD